MVLFPFLTSSQAKMCYDTSVFSTLMQLSFTLHLDIIIVFVGEGSLFILRFHPDDND